MSAIRARTPRAEVDIDIVNSPVDVSTRHRDFDFYPEIATVTLQPAATSGWESRCIALYGRRRLLNGRLGRQRVVETWTPLGLADAPQLVRDVLAEAVRVITAVP